MPSAKIISLALRAVVGVEAGELANICLLSILSLKAHPVRKSSRGHRQRDRTLIIWAVVISTALRREQMGDV